MYHVYIIFSVTTGRYYTGYTSDLKKRLGQHNSGATTSTRAGRPWKLVYAEKLENARQAWMRERQIKRYKGGEAFKKLIRHGEVA